MHIFKNKIKLYNYITKTIKNINNKIDKYSYKYKYRESKKPI